MQHGQATGWISIATAPPPVGISDPAAIYAAAHERLLEHHADLAAHLVDLLEVVRQFLPVDDDAPLLATLLPRIIWIDIEPSSSCGMNSAPSLVNSHPEPAKRTRAAATTSQRSRNAPASKGV